MAESWLGSKKKWKRNEERKPECMDESMHSGFAVMLQRYDAAAKGGR